MNKAAAIVVALILIIGGVVGVMALTNKDNKAPANTVSTSKTDTPSEETLNTSSSGQSRASQSTDMGTNSGSVSIKNNSFSPSTIIVKKGATVTWTNEDSVKHDIMPDNPSDNFKASELLANGESYTFTFNTPGEYTYHCTPHPFMKGTVKVTE